VSLVTIVITPPVYYGYNTASEYFFLPLGERRVVGIKASERLQTTNKTVSKRKIITRVNPNPFEE